MATNTRWSACRAQGECRETESRGRTEDADSYLHVTSKAAVSRGNRNESLPALRSYAYGAELNKDKEVALDADFTTKEDKLEYYISLI
jgi:hypothetical protein